MTDTETTDTDIEAMANDPDAHGYTDNGVDPAEITRLFNQSYPNADIVVEAPTLTTLAPTSIVAGTPTEVTITGTKFIGGVSTVVVDGIKQLSEFVSVTSMKYLAEATSAGAQTVKVRNGGLHSNGIELTVTDA